MSETRKWSIPDEWALLPDVADRLNLKREAVKSLVLSEFASTLPGVSGRTCSRAGDLLLLRRDALDALSAIPYVDDLGVALRYRLAPLPEGLPTWHASMGVDVAQHLISNNITFRQLPQWFGFPLIGHVSGFVVTAGLIVSATYDKDSMTGTAVLDFTAPEATAYLGRRFEPPRGTHVSMK